MAKNYWFIVKKLTGEFLKLEFRMQLNQLVY